MKTTERIRRILLPIIIALLFALPVYAECSHEFVEMREEPGCETPGLSWLECIHCGYTTNYQPIEKLGHVFGEWYVLNGPTCNQEGLQARDCTVCGHQQTEPIPSTGHTYSAEVRYPTCTAGGYTRYNCSTCSSYYISDYSQPLGHCYNEGVLIKEPTETALGRVRFTCIRCSESYLMTYAFRDIPSDAYYFTPVIWAVNAGIASGIDETHFAPDSICNRAQVVTFLWRAAGKPEVSGNNPFADVPAGCFYDTAVLWAYTNGITIGTDATHFSPDAPCNRAQVVTFLHRFRGCPEPTAENIFPDVSSDDFYYEAVRWAAQRGITVGMDGGYFKPNLPCTRGQIVTFLYRDEHNP
ncbi:MAG: S-layer homology domain-containing protein [Oscillospiraceae bacterium]|nr:S-layer homology domain-containing protein [Oscillospiraceae bacterium]